jgi:hypothetical protein
VSEKRRDKLTKSGKIMGRPRKVRAPSIAAPLYDEDDGIEDLPWPEKRKTRPERPSSEVNRGIILAEISKRGGQKTIQERAWNLMPRLFPRKEDQSPENLEAIERWLREPARSAPPTAETVMKRRRRLSSEK